MDDPKLKNFIKTLKSVSLQPEEKRFLRSQLLTKIGVRKESVYWWQLVYLRSWSAVIVLIVFLITSSGGVSLAAEGSLPGEWLYPIKTKVNEPVARAITTTLGQTRADFETNLAEKRLDEVRGLEAQNKLDDKSEQQLEQLKENINQQVAKAKTLSSPVIEVKEADAPEKDDKPVRKNMTIKIEPKEHHTKLEKVLIEHQEVVEKLNRRIEDRTANRHSLRDRRDN